MKMTANELLRMLHENGITPGSYECATIIARNMPRKVNERKLVLTTVFNQILKEENKQRRLRRQAYQP